MTSEKAVEHEVGFEFLEQVSSFFSSHLGMSESVFSQTMLNGTKDYYAYLKSSGNLISDDKLESLLVNLNRYRQLVSGQIKVSDPALFDIQRTKELDVVDGFVARLSWHFFRKRANKVNIGLDKIVNEHGRISG